MSYAQTILTWMGSVMGILSLSCNIINYYLLSLFASFADSNREERYLRNVIFPINFTSMELHI